MRISKLLKLPIAAMIFVSLGCGRCGSSSKIAVDDNKNKTTSSHIETIKNQIEGTS